MILNECAKILLSCICMILSFTGSANLLQPQSFSMSDGLPSNNVRDIYEDSRGIVWLSTDVGVFEFTGEEVRFRKELFGIQGERVNSLLEDKSGNLWISTSERLYQFDGRKLKTIILDSLSNGTDITSLYEDVPGNRLMVGTSEGLFQLNFENLKFSSVLGSKGISALSLLENDEQLLIMEREQAKDFELNLKTNKIKHLSVDDSLPEIDFQDLPNIHQALKCIESGKFYITDKNKEQKILCDVLEKQEGKDESYFLLRFFEKGNEKRKLLCADKNSIKDLTLEFQLDQYFIQTIFLKKELDDLWLGTREHGLISIKKSIFSYYDSSFLKLQGTSLSDFVVDKKGTITVASKNELVSFQNGEIVNRIKSDQFCKFCPKINRCHKDFAITKLGIDPKGLIWIATTNGFYTLTSNNFELSFKGITKAENFLILQNDLLCFSNNQFQFYTNKGIDKSKPEFCFTDVNLVDVSKMMVHPSGIWISTRERGILRYRDGKFKLFNRSNSEIPNIVNDLLILPDSTILVARNNGIIYKIGNHKDHLSVIDSISERNGLIGTSIHGMQILDDGSLWVGTNLGINRFDSNSWQNDSVVDSKFWNSKDGYFDQTGVKSVLDENQNILVLTRNQVLKVSTLVDSYLKGNSACKLLLQNIQIHNRDWISDSSKMNKWTKAYQDPITLNHTQNFLTFQFGFSYCKNVSNLRFRYKLEGFDKNWSQWSSSKKIVYSNLSHGDFILRVEGKSLSQGDLEPISIRITIKSSWWKSWWFVGSVVVILMGIFFLSFKMYASVIRKKEKGRTKQFNRVIGLKMRALQNQMDPHFIFNSLNSIQSYILEENTNKALEYLSDFSLVMRKNISNANKDFISLSDEISYLKNYLKLEQMRFSDKFIFDIEMDSEIHSQKIKLPPMLIQPFLENAVKYGLSGCDGKGELRLKFFIIDSYLKCIIEDNGIGRERAKLQIKGSNIMEHHKTMKITNDRIKLLNTMVAKGKQKYSYSIHDVINPQNESFGTRVELFFPTNH